MTEQKKSLSVSDIDLWEIASAEYAEFAEKKDYFRQHLLNKDVVSLLGDVSGKKTLDAGCGEGYFARIIAKMGGVVTGVDASPNLIETAKKKSESGLSFLIHDLRKPLPFANDAFDFILANMVLMDFDPIKPTVEEFARVLKRDGFMIFSIVHPFFAAAKVKNNLKEKIFRETPHCEIREYKSERKFIKKIGGLSHPTAFYRRSLEYYAKVMEECGFCITALREPVLSKEETRKNHKPFFRLVSETPIYLIMKAGHRVS